MLIKSYYLEKIYSKSKEILVLMELSISLEIDQPPNMENLIIWS